VNRPTLRAALLVVCAALCAGLLSACGEADDVPDAAAASSVSQTVGATSKLDNAHLTASFELAPDGLMAMGGPIAFRASGPFAAAAKGELPRFDLAIAGSLARTPLRARAISTGKHGFVTIDGRSYKLDQDLVDGLRSALAGGTAGGGGLATLGLDPQRWMKDPRANGGATIGGVDTDRISGTIDVRALLADVAKLLGVAGGADALLTPRLRKQIEDAVTSSKVDIWSGARDKILRQLAVVVDFAFKQGASPVAGLEGGKVTLRVRLDRVNATTVDPVAPKGARPLSDLLGHDDLGALLPGLGTGLPSAKGSRDGGDAFLKCLNSAGGSAADVAACASKLAAKP
jgi:hypothetical protein